eukprot:7353324-Pyramimonas_sp.AAC.1
MPVPEPHVQRAPGSPRARLGHGHAQRREVRPATVHDRMGGSNLMCVGSCMIRGRPMATRVSTQ